MLSRPQTMKTSLHHLLRLPISIIPCSSSIFKYLKLSKNYVVPDDLVSFDPQVSSMLLWSFLMLWDVPAFSAAFCQLLGIKSFLAYPYHNPEKWKGKNLLSPWNDCLQRMQSWGENRRLSSNRATVEEVNNRFNLLDRKNHWAKKPQHFLFQYYPLSGFVHPGRMLENKKE